MSPGDQHDPSTAPSPTNGEARPLPIVARDLVRDVQDLVSQEISVAKAEVTDTIVRAAKAAAMFAVAGVLSLYLLDFVFETIAHALEGPLPDWAAWLVVTILILVIIVVLALVGKSFLPKQAPGKAAREELDATKAVVTERLAEVQRAFAPGATTKGTDHG